MAIHPPASPSLASPREALALDIRWALYLSLRVTGFLGTNLLVTWGLFVLFFVAIGGFTVDGFAHQLNNLTNRFVHADAGRVADFKLIVAATQMLLFAAVAVLRRHSLFSPQDRRWSPRHG